MIIKVMKTNDDDLCYTLFDNVSNIHIEKCRTENWEDLGLWEGDDCYYFLRHVEEYKPNTEVKFDLIIFKQNGKSTTIVFNTHVYILNDNGKTLEVIR